MPMVCRGFVGSWARDSKAGALSVLIVISDANRIGVVVMMMPLMMSCLLSDWTKVVVV